MLEMGEVLATSTDLEERRATFRAMLENFDKNPHGALLHTLAGFMAIRSDRLAMDPIPSEYLDLTTDGVTFK
jgi:peptide/nickel transport system substrate-binding protein